MIDGNTTFSELPGLLAGAGLQLVRLVQTSATPGGRAPRWDPAAKTLHQPRAWCATVIILSAHRRSGLTFVFDGEGDTMQSAIADAVESVQRCVRARDEASAPTDDDLRDEAAERRGDERRGQ